MTPRVLVVSGSRDLQDDSGIAALIAQFGPDEVVHGGCRGADMMADKLARASGIRVVPFNPDPDTPWPKAAHDRNQRMVDYAVKRENEGATVCVACFPGPRSKGTWDFHRRATRAGLAVNLMRQP